MNAFFDRDSYKEANDSLLSLVQYGSAEGVEQFLKIQKDAGMPCDINLLHPNGTSLIGLAVERGNTSLAEVLIKYGAPVDVPDSFRITPVDLAKFYQNNEMLELLQKAQSSLENTSRPC